MSDASPEQPPQLTMMQQILQRQDPTVPQAMQVLMAIIQAALPGWAVSLQAWPDSVPGPCPVSYITNRSMSQMALALREVVTAVEAQPQPQPQPAVIHDAPDTMQ